MKYIYWGSKEKSLLKVQNLEESHETGEAHNRIPRMKNLSCENEVGFVVRRRSFKSR